MKIAAVAILYHPEKDAILNIKSYYDYVDKIFVFDNSETRSDIQEDLLKLSKVDFYHDFNNEGMAKRLNEACKMALSKQFDWILTMDQDSNFPPDIIKSYFNCFYSYKAKEKVAMFGTNNSRKKISIINDCTTKEVVELITSGSLLNLSLFKKIGGFDECLFIDIVDTEYCARARMKDYAIIVFSGIYLIHQFGKQIYNSSIKSLFMIKKKKEIHSPLRCYYMYRNMLYVERKYKDVNKSFTVKLRNDVIARIKICLLYSRDTINILKYLMEARKDFKNNKMGKKTDS